MTPKTSSDSLYDRIAQNFRSQAFLTLLGAQLRSVAPGKVVISCPSWDSSRACSTGVWWPPSPTSPAATPP